MSCLRRQSILFRVILSLNLLALIPAILYMYIYTYRYRQTQIYFLRNALFEYFINENWQTFHYLITRNALFVVQYLNSLNKIFSVILLFDTPKYPAMVSFCVNVGSLCEHIPYTCTHNNKFALLSRINNFCKLAKQRNLQLHKQS